MNDNPEYQQTLAYRTAVRTVRCPQCGAGPDRACFTVSKLAFYKDDGIRGVDWAHEARSVAYWLTQQETVESGDLTLANGSSIAIQTPSGRVVVNYHSAVGTHVVAHATGQDRCAETINLAPVIEQPKPPFEPGEHVTRRSASGVMLWHAIVADAPVPPQYANGARIAVKRLGGAMNGRLAYPPAALLEKGWNE